MITAAWIFLSMILAIALPKSLRAKTVWVVIIVILAVLAYRNDRHQAAQIEELSKESHRQTALVDTQAAQIKQLEMILRDMDARVGNRELLEDAIKWKTLALQGSVPSQSESLAKKLLDELPKDQAQYKALRNESDELSGQLRIAWEPIYRSFLQRFDNIAADMKHNGVKVCAGESPDYPVVIEGFARGQRLTPRTVELEDAYSLAVGFFPGIVEMGSLTQTPRFWLEGRSRGRVTWRLFIGVNLKRDKIEWTVGDAAYTEGSSSLWC